MSLSWRKLVKMSSIEYLITMWETVKEYVPSKDRQAAADHVINELVEIGIDDDDLEALAVDKQMLTSIKEHIEVHDRDEDEDDN